jgi:hypothetical protein
MRPKTRPPGLGCLAEILPPWQWASLTGSDTVKPVHTVKDGSSVADCVHDLTCCFGLVNGGWTRGHFASASRYARTIDVESGSHAQWLMTSAGYRNPLYDGETAATTQPLPTGINSTIIPVTRQPHQVDDAFIVDGAGQQPGHYPEHRPGWAPHRLRGCHRRHLARRSSRVRDGHRRRTGRRRGRSLDRRHGRIQS